MASRKRHADASAIEKRVTRSTTRGLSVSPTESTESPKLRTRRGVTPDLFSTSSQYTPTKLRTRRASVVDAPLETVASPLRRSRRLSTNSEDVATPTKTRNLRSIRTNLALVEDPVLEEDELEKTGPKKRVGSQKGTKASPTSHVQDPSCPEIAKKDSEKKQTRNRSNRSSENSPLISRTLQTIVKLKRVNKELNRETVSPVKTADIRTFLKKKVESSPHNNQQGKAHSEKLESPKDQSTTKTNELSFASSNEKSKRTLRNSQITKEKRKSQDVETYSASPKNATGKLDISKQEELGERRLSATKKISETSSSDKQTFTSSPNEKEARNKSRNSTTNSPSSVIKVEKELSSGQEDEAEENFRRSSARKDKARESYNAQKNSTHRRESEESIRSVEHNETAAKVRESQDDENSSKNMHFVRQEEELPKDVETDQKTIVADEISPRSAKGAIRESGGQAETEETSILDGNISKPNPEQDVNLEKNNAELVSPVKNQFTFSKSWSQSVKGEVDKLSNSCKAIDVSTLKKLSEDHGNADQLLQGNDSSAEKRKSQRTESSEEDEDDMEDDEENETEIKSPSNELLDCEAMEASDSENSLDSSERAYLEANEIPVRGESIGSRDTTEESNGEEEEEAETEEEEEEEEEEDDLTLLSASNSEIDSLDSGDTLMESNNVVKQRKTYRKLFQNIDTSSDEEDKHELADTEKKSASANVTDSPVKNDLQEKDSDMKAGALKCENKEIDNSFKIGDSSSVRSELNKSNDFTSNNKSSLNITSEDNNKGSSKKNCDPEISTQNTSIDLQKSIVADDSSAQLNGSVQNRNSVNVVENCEKDGQSDGNVNEQCISRRSSLVGKKDQNITGTETHSSQIEQPGENGIRGTNNVGENRVSQGTHQAVLSNSKLNDLLGKGNTDTTPFTSMDALDSADNSMSLKASGGAKKSPPSVNPNSLESDPLEYDECLADKQNTPFEKGNSISEKNSLSLNTSKNKSFRGRNSEESTSEHESSGENGQGGLVNNENDTSGTSNEPYRLNVSTKSNYSSTASSKNANDVNDLLNTEKNNALSEIDAETGQSTKRLTMMNMSATSASGKFKQNDSCADDRMPTEMDGASSSGKKRLSKSMSPLQIHRNSGSRNELSKSDRVAEIQRSTLKDVSDSSSSSNEEETDGPSEANNTSNVTVKCSSIEGTAKLLNKRRSQQMNASKNRIQDSSSDSEEYSNVLINRSKQGKSQNVLRLTQISSNAETSSNSESNNAGHDEPKSNSQLNISRKQLQTNCQSPLKNQERQQHANDAESVNGSCPRKSRERVSDGADESDVRTGSPSTKTMSRRSLENKSTLENTSESFRGFKNSLAAETDSSSEASEKEPRLSPVEKMVQKIMSQFCRKIEESNQSSDDTTDEEILLSKSKSIASKQSKSLSGSTETNTLADDEQSSSKSDEGEQISTNSINKLRHNELNNSDGKRHIIKMIADSSESSDDSADENMSANQLNKSDQKRHIIKNIADSTESSDDSGDENILQKYVIDVVTVSPNSKPNGSNKRKSLLENTSNRTNESIERRKFSGGSDDPVKLDNEPVMEKKAQLNLSTNKIVNTSKNTSGGVVPLHTNVHHEASSSKTFKDNSRGERSLLNTSKKVTSPRNTESDTSIKLEMPAFKSLKQTDHSTPANKKIKIKANKETCVFSDEEEEHEVCEAFEKTADGLTNLSKKSVVDDTSFTICSGKNQDESKKKTQKSLNALKSDFETLPTSPSDNSIENHLSPVKTKNKNKEKTRKRGDGRAKKQQSEILKEVIINKIGEAVKEGKILPSKEKAGVLQKANLNIPREQQMISAFAAYNTQSKKKHKSPKSEEECPNAKKFKSSNEAGNSSKKTNEKKIQASVHTKSSVAQIATIETSDSSGSSMDNKWKVTKAKSKKRLNILTETPFGFKERPATPKKVSGFDVTCPSPKPIGWKVKSIISAGQKDVPEIRKKSSKHKRNKVKNISDSGGSTSPTRVWTSIGYFQVSDADLPKKQYRPESHGAKTDFLVETLGSKKRKAQESGECFSLAALDFKRKSTFNDKVVRESSKQLLQKKIKKKY